MINKSVYASEKTILEGKPSQRAMPWPAVTNWHWFFITRIYGFVDYPYCLEDNFLYKFFECS